MKLRSAKKWLENHKEWRGKITSKMPVSTMDDLDRLNRKYVMGIQANAMLWCVGKDIQTIHNKAERLLRGNTT